LIDEETGEGQNLAKIKGDNSPITIRSIKDLSKSKAFCSGGSQNAELFWKYYDRADNPLEAAVDFVGLTKEMSSEIVKVVPGRKYRIKLAVIDFCTSMSHSSAAFFNAGSFDLGNLDLGQDLLIENGNALCNGESKVIKSGIGLTDQTEIRWYKDDELIVGAESPDYEVKETGKYKVVVKYPAISCEVFGEILVEIFPAISTVVDKPAVIPVCRKATKSIIVNLKEVEGAMLKRVNPKDYAMTYFLDKQDALNGINQVDAPEVFEFVPNGEDKVIFIQVSDVRTGCTEIFELILRATKGEIPQEFGDVEVCAVYVFPALESDLYYYSDAGGKGQSFKVGDRLTIPGKHVVYVFKDNGDGCYEETSYSVSITNSVVADVFEDKTIECELYILKPLSENNRYFSLPHGEGYELFPGMLIPTTQTIFVYAISEDGICNDESSFTITYNDCPIPKGISPNGDGLNDNFDLSMHGVTSIIVFNRYGTEVYSFNGNYTDQWIGHLQKNYIDIVAIKNLF